jgi:hypothetical protein
MFLKHNYSYSTLIHSPGFYSESEEASILSAGEAQHSSEVEHLKCEIVRWLTFDVTPDLSPVGRCPRFPVCSPLSPSLSLSLFSQSRDAYYAHSLTPCALIIRAT